MKKCPSRDAINQDYDYDCGVCGTTLSGVVSKDTSILEAETLAKPLPKSSIHLRGPAAALATGLAITGAGLYLFFASGPIGLLLLLIGVPATSLVFKGQLPQFADVFFMVVMARMPLSGEKSRRTSL